MTESAKYNNILPYQPPRYAMKIYQHSGKVLSRKVRDYKHLSESEGESHSLVSDSLWPHGMYSSWNSPVQNTGVGSLSLL